MYIYLMLGIIISDVMTSLILIILLSEASTLIGFDCGGQNLNVTTVSLLDVGECDLKIRKPNTSSVHIQLLQLSDYSHTKVIQCKIEISRTIFHCGMHSRIFFFQPFTTDKPIMSMKPDIPSAYVCFKTEV